MTTGPTTGQLEFVLGQLLGTQAAVRALILLHPDVPAAAHRVEQEMERWLAVAVTQTSVSDRILQGIDSATTAVLSGLRDPPAEAAPTPSERTGRGR